MTAPATVLDRADAAMGAHTLAWAKQRQADRDGRWEESALWASVRAAALEELAECCAAIEAGVDAGTRPPPPPLPADTILRGNADLAEPAHAYLR